MNTFNEAQCMEENWFEKLSTFVIGCITREKHTVSKQGGHVKTTVIHDKDDVTIEDIELFCNTLKFEHIVKSVPKNDTWVQEQKEQKTQDDQQKK